MQYPSIVEREILDELHHLEPQRWFEVLDFIGYLKQHPFIDRSNSSQKKGTALDLIQSPLIGLWADRDDIDDSTSYAKKLRWQAEHRMENRNDLA